MASILKPFVNILNPGRYQVPTGQLTIDWTHPLANGLIGCWLPGAMRGLDLTGNAGLVPPDPTAGEPEDNISQDGPGSDATYNSSTSPQYFVSPAPPPLLAWTSAAVPQASLFWRGYLKDPGSSSFPSFVGFNYNQPISPPFNLFLLQFNSGDQINVAYNDGGTQENLTAAVPAAGMHSVAATLVQGGNAVLWIDAVSQASQAVTNGPQITATSPLLFGGCVGGVSNMMAIWNRALSQSELLAMHLAPYDFIIPAEYEMPVMFNPPVQLPLMMFNMLIPVIGTVSVSINP